MTFERCIADLTLAAGHLEGLSGPLNAEQKARLCQVIDRIKSRAQEKISEC